MERAALEIYAERGTLKMTAAEIATRAGTTERTFFRHFPDKLDAFFGDESRLRSGVAEVIRACPPEMSPLGAALTGFQTLAADFEAHRVAIRQRAAAVAAHPELQAREFARTAPWTVTVKDALRARGAADVEVELVAPMALSVFRIAYERWIDTPGRSTFDARLRDAVREMQLAAGRANQELGDPGSRPGRSRQM
jgi:AcrR family transcriptional regulator